MARAMTILILFALAMFAFTIFAIAASRASGRNRSTTPSLPSQLGWSASEAGNQTRTYANQRVTVFESDGGWKYCIAHLGEDDDPYFSDPYETQAAAKACALAFLDGRDAPFQTKRETREAEHAQQATAFGREAPARLITYQAELRSMYTDEKFLLTPLRKLKKSCSRDEKMLIEAYKESYSRIGEAASSHLWEMKAQFNAIEANVDDLIKWIEEGGKKAKTSPPPLRLVAERDKA